MCEQVKSVIIEAWLQNRTTISFKKLTRIQQFEAHSLFHPLNLNIKHIEPTFIFKHIRGMEKVIKQAGHFIYLEFSFGKKAVNTAPPCEM
ncbi:hypothetical protein PthBH41_32780 [Parageobacillus thermoglucosidasius]|nr:hypothetical protein PthBH41_32780 [Parageobacillus thermoglucosidasius]